jgi:hypothetical protein
VLDVLYLAALLAFFALMIAFVSRYDRFVGNGEYDLSDMAEEATGRDERSSSKR